MRRDMKTPCTTRGFTLIELVLVIVIGAAMTAVLVSFFRPAIAGYLASRARADLTEQADAALGRIARDVRSAVPNSIRMPDSQCLELVPTSSGGGLRTGPDTVNDNAPGCLPSATCAAPLDNTQATAVFDVLTLLASPPAIGDWVVVGNQTPTAIYEGLNRAAIVAVSTPAASQGRTRIAVASTQFQLGDGAGRFNVVPGGQGPVFYVCSGADGSLDASGNGKGTLYRKMNYGFIAAHPTACPSTVGADVLATHVTSCAFVYDPNQGATQQSGFVWLQFGFARQTEQIQLVMGAHVANGP